MCICAIYFSYIYFYVNTKKNISAPAPLLVKLGGEKSQLVRNEILKAAWELKNSTKFQNVFISPDLSPYQRRRLNELKLIRNDLNKKLNVLPSPVSYYYGIRNNKVIKIKRYLSREWKHPNKKNSRFIRRA